jgi:two-component system chemotaxis response regulator CheY
MTRSILIVDDSSSLRAVVGIALRGAGYDVLEACDGRDALAKLDGRKVHLIVSDLNMPVMDGIAFLKAVKQLPSYRFTPFVMLTTESADARKQQGREAGAKAWMVKPFKPDQMLAVVQKLVMP